VPDRAYLYKTDLEQWRWTRKSSNGETIAASTESYRNKSDAVKNYERVAGSDSPLLEDLSSNPDDESSTTP
jgi:uncharacterized protein YegP (UPF0339 family)